MAYISDSAWCHGKVVGLSDKAFRVWVCGIAYSSGMNTRGILENSQQKLVGSTPRIRAELVSARLWDEAGKGSVKVHGWDEYNGKRDERKEADRERKRRARANGHDPGVSAGRPQDSPQETERTDSGLSAGTSAGRPRVRARARPPSEGSEGSEGRDITASNEAAETATSPADSPDAQRLVAEFVFGCKQAGIEAPKRLIGQVAQETGKLIREGIPPDRIRDGYRRMVQRGIVQPSLLPNFVAEASIPPDARAANGAGMTPAQILEMTRETP